MKPNADHKTVITYTVRQKTTAPDQRKTIAAFEAELRLQYGSTVEITSVKAEDGRPPQTEELFADEYETPAEYRASLAADLDQGDREAIMNAAGLAYPWQRKFADAVLRGEDLHVETTGRRGGW